jgi:two-component sensor histidine kinase
VVDVFQPRLTSVWSRLIGPLALVVAPAALLMSLLAYSLFGEALENLRARQAGAATSSAGALQSWFDAAGHSLANEAVAAGYVDAQRCSALADAFLRRNPGFSAVRFLEPSAPCAAGAAIDVTRLPAQPAAQAGGDAAYRVLASTDRVWIASLSGATPEKISSLLVVDDASLQQRLRGENSFGATEAALVSADGEVVSGDPRMAKAPWLPSMFEKASHESVWRCPDRSGAMASFALASVRGSGLGVLMRFNDAGLLAARRRLAILCLSELFMLGLLAYAYAATIRRNVVAWIHGIDNAARAWGDDPESGARAPVAKTMPRELRSVAESFNAMADRAIARQDELTASLAENRALMLEMHHRIKNSLQVIQSYLALIRRTAARPEAQLLARIEARVGVLAIAYRLALTPKGLRPIAVKPFLEEICASAIGGLRGPRQRVAYAIAWEGELIVDRAIPLGLGLVEALVAALSAADVSYVGVRLAANESGEVQLRVESDAAPAETGLPARVMRGLASQLGAVASSEDAGEILDWRFQP